MRQHALVMKYINIELDIFIVSPDPNTDVEFFQG